MVFTFRIVFELSHPYFDPSFYFIEQYFPFQLQMLPLITQYVYAYCERFIYDEFNYKATALKG